MKYLAEFPPCFNCKHRLGVNSCEAFNIIPQEILTGENDHSEPLPDQNNNIVFESVDNESEDI